MLTGLVVTAARFKVRPSTMLASVLVGELTARPLTVAAALAAVWVCVIALAPADGSKPRAGTPELRNAFSAPLVFERSSSREPFASVMMSAVTPAPAVLILSRTSVSVSVAATLMSMAVAPAFGANVVCPAPQVPSSRCSVPPPGVAAVDAKTPVASVCTLASVCTATE